MASLDDFKKINDYLWEIPKDFRRDMRVPARVYASRSMLAKIIADRSLEQLTNVATLPGIEGYAVAMPDIHQGYGFPIGGVAALRASDGVISPGGVGYDINCGVRLLASRLSAGELGDHLTALANQLQRDVPSGVGRGGHFVLELPELDEVLNEGVRFAVKKGWAEEADLDLIEENGAYPGADAAAVPLRAKTRGRDQLGTIGSGNHFLEIQRVVEIFDSAAAAAYGLRLDQVTVMIHTGSRGLGHETCTEYVRRMGAVMKKYGIVLPDRELASAPFASPEGQTYFKAMAAAANFAWVNRQVITYQARQAWRRILGDSPEARLDLVYDVAHNIAKKETYDGRELIVHRKGATRAFGPGRSEVPAKYRAVGQPVLIPGSMGTSSYVLAGTTEALEQAFGSSCHGAGRAMSRQRAKTTLDYQAIKKDLADQGIILRVHGAKELLEEAPAAYKDVDEVVDIVQRAGLAKKVARLKPLAVIKG